MVCEAPTISPALTRPLPPLKIIDNSSCEALLNNYMDNIAICADWAAKYNSLVEAVAE